MRTVAAPCALAPFALACEHSIMTPNQIAHEISRVGRVPVALSHIASLAAAAQALDVRWTFAPDTPTDVVQYLGAAVVGGAQGLAIGGACGVLLALFFPPAIIGYAMAGGAVVGAIRGANRVAQGWRVQLLLSPYGEQYLDVSVV
jgi:hypothetical protein